MILLAFVFPVLPLIVAGTLKKIALNGRFVCYPCGVTLRQ
jgi:hypothetical protein